MPLSEQEQRALALLEAQLSADDPKFASAMVADPSRALNKRRLLVGLLLVLAGIVIVGVSVWQQMLWLSAPGFLLMVAGAVFASSRRSTQLHLVGSEPRRGPASARRPSAAATRTPGQGDFMNRLEERWERRRRESQGW